MKKIKGFSKLIAVMIILMLAISMTIGSIGIAFAGQAPNTGDPISEFTVPTSLTYGEDVKFSIGAGVQLTITAPNGKEITKNVDDEYKFDQLGNYTFTWKQGNEEYKKQVLCSLEDEILFRVENSGLGLPMYAAKGLKITNSNATDGVNTFPKATLYKKLSDGTYEDLNAAYDIIVYAPDGVTASETTVASGAEYEFANVGTYVVSYVCKLDGGAKVYSQDYKINVKSSYTNTQLPVLTVNNIPSSLSLNTKVTLPKAEVSTTVSENKNVVVKVTVKVDGNAVKEALVDTKTGYATGTTANDVNFENDFNMSFYPTVLDGQYVIEYQAIDFYGNKSNIIKNTITCVDKTAPQLIKIADDQIPSDWALTVNKAQVGADNKVIKNASGVVQTEATNYGTTIKFPMPEYSDNSGDVVKVKFTIKNSTDSTNSSEVLSITNINARETDGTVAADAKFTKNSVYTEDVEFTDNGFTFDFTKYEGNAKNNNLKTGTYTVTYTATDSKNQSSTKEYTITVSETKEYLANPEVNVEFDEYIYAGNKKVEYTIPTATASDSNDSRLAKVYTISNGTDTLDVESGDVLIINDIDVNGTVIKAAYLKSDTDKYGNLISGATTLDVSATSVLKFNFKATNDVGLFDSEESDVVLLKASDFTGNITATSIDLNDHNYVDGSITDLVGINNDGTYYTGDAINVGGLAISAQTNALRKYTGFEITVLDENGNILSSGLSLETFRPKNSNLIIIKDITFSTNTAGDYKIVVRAFDITGNSQISTIPVEVIASSTGGSGEDVGTNTAATFVSEGTVGKSYTLQNSGSTNKPVHATKKFISRKITNAGQFSLLGDDFTAYTKGTTYFQEVYYEADDFDDATTLGDKYHFTADSSETITMSLQGKMPVYAAKYVANADGSLNIANALKLPLMIGYTSSVNSSDVTLTVKYNSTKVDVHKYNYDEGTSTYTQADKDAKVFDGYYVMANSDGKYSVEYTALVSGLTNGTASYEVLVGDTRSVSFTIAENTTTYVANKSNNLFNFEVMNLDTIYSDSTKMDNVEITKTVKFNGEEVYSVTGTGTTGANKKTESSSDDGYQFTQDGIYTVIYKTVNPVNNLEYTETVYITVNGAATSNPEIPKIITIVVVSLGILILAGALVYIAAFSKKKTNKK